jgi:hypothetical protein
MTNQTLITDLAAIPYTTPRIPADCEIVIPGHHIEAAEERFRGAQPGDLWCVVHTDTNKRVRFFELV